MKNKTKIFATITLTIATLLTACGSKEKEASPENKNTVTPSSLIYEDKERLWFTVYKENSEDWGRKSQVADGSFISKNGKTVLYKYAFSDYMSLGKIAKMSNSEMITTIKKQDKNEFKKSIEYSKKLAERSDDMHMNPEKVGKSIQVLNTLKYESPTYQTIKISNFITPDSSGNNSKVTSETLKIKYKNLKYGSISYNSETGDETDKYLTKEFNLETPYGPFQVYNKWYIGFIFDDNRMIVTEVPNKNIIPSLDKKGASHVKAVIDQD